MNLNDLTSSISLTDAVRNVYVLERTPLSQIKEEYYEYHAAAVDLLLYTERLLNTLMFSVRASGASPLNLITDRWCLHTSYLSKVFTGKENHNWVNWRCIIGRFLETMATTSIKDTKAESLAHDVACWCVILNDFSEKYDEQFLGGEVARVLELAMPVVTNLSNGNLEAIRMPQPKV